MGVFRRNPALKQPEQVVRYKLGAWGRAKRVLFRAGVWGGGSAMLLSTVAGMGPQLRDNYRLLMKTGAESAYNATLNSKMPSAGLAEQARMRLFDQKAWAQHQQQKAVAEILARKAAKDYIGSWKNKYTNAKEAGKQVGFKVTWDTVKGAWKVLPYTAAATGFTGLTSGTRIGTANLIKKAWRRRRRKKMEQRERQRRNKGIGQ